MAYYKALKINGVCYPLCTNIYGNGCPTPTTVGELGQEYIDLDNKKSYTCIKIENDTYTWELTGTNGEFDNSLSIGRKEGFDIGEKSIAVGTDVVASNKNTVSFGANSIAGGRGYKLTAFTNNGDGTGICTVRTTEGLAVNMEYSIRVANMFCKAGKITAINGLNVTINGVPENAKWETDDAENPESFTVENYLTIVDHPELGDTDVGFNAVSIGENNIAQDRASYTEGRQNKSIGQYAHTEGRKNIAGYAAHAEGRDNIALGDMSHAEGHEVIASGNMSHAEGFQSQAIGKGSHAEGIHSMSEGEYAHAEGVYTKAIGKGAHSEGYQSKAIGEYAHAEGVDNQAYGNHTHVEGKGNIARGTDQHVQGRYNIDDVNNEYAHIVGNGTSNTDRSNIHTVSWDGHGWFKNSIRFGGSNQGDANIIRKGSGQNSFILGDLYCSNSGGDSMVIGTSCNVSGYHAFAGGYHSKTSGSVGFAFGENANAKKNASTALGKGTIANTNEQLVHGRYNVEDVLNTYAHIIGNGTSDTDRKNIYSLDWNGNGWFAGKVEAGQQTTDEDSDLVLVTKGYMTEKTEDFTVEVTYTYDTKTITANTAFADIQQAIISGKNVVLNLSFVYTGGLYIEGEKLILPLAAFYEDSRVVFATAQTNKIYTISCRTGESWHFEESTIKEPSYVSQLLNTTSSSSVPTANAVVSYVDNKIGNMFNLKGSVDYYQDLPTSDLKNGDAYRIEKDSSIDPYRMVIHQVYNEQANIFQMTASGVEGIYFKLPLPDNWEELTEGKTSIELIITDSGAAANYCTFTLPIVQSINYANSGICNIGASIEAVIVKSEYENYDSELFPLIMETETDDGTVYMSFADDEMIYVYNGTNHVAFAGDVAVYVGTSNDTNIDSDDDEWCILTTSEVVLRNPVKAGSKTNSAVIGNRATAIGMNSIAYGTATANSNLSLAGGAKSEANGTGSIAIGNAAKTNSSYCVALGSRSEANASYSVALGFYTKTEGSKAIAAGNHSEANGDSSVAIGYYSIADGDQSVAFGYETYAGGDYSLATGMNTSANGDVQFVSGRYNKKDEKNKFAVIVGNGEDEDVKDSNGNIITQNRSNAYTLNWEGDAWYAGRVKVGRSTTDEDEDLVLVSKDYLKSYVESYVDSAIKEAFNITEADEGKVLKVVDGKAVWVENEFPEVKPEDEGRYLQIVNGAPTWVELDYQNAEEVAY